MLRAVLDAHQRRDERGAPLVNPCRDPYVVKLLQTIRRAHAKRGRTEVRRDAATVDVLEQMLDCASDSLREVRDRAVLLVGFNAGGRGRSEIARLSVERLVADRDGYLQHAQNGAVVRISERVSAIVRANIVRHSSQSAERDASRNERSRTDNILLCATGKRKYPLRLILRRH